MSENAVNGNDERRTHETAYFAGGCFWGMERYFQAVDGVTGTTVGYAQSKVENPTYEQVCSGETDAAETVKVEFDPARVSLRTLSLLFLEAIDPFSVDAQGPDHGRQYRTGMFYIEGDAGNDADATGDAAGSAAAGMTEAGAEASAPAGLADDGLAGDGLAARSIAAHATGNEQRDVYVAALEQLIDRDPRRPAVLVEPLRNFYPAEEHHQDYLEKNPGGYCHIPMAKIANVRNRQKYVERIWDLTLEQFAVTQRAATERPFTNAYDRTFEPGVYVDVVSGEPLFLSTDKFDSGCGWPAFSKPISADLLTEHEDDRVPGRPRIEVRTADTQIHLGHVFADGPADRGGLRYCMNSAALRFVPKSRMAEEGYGDLIPRLEE
ncbi:peptide-methionine (R)-S-oxide reductase MsrB [Bifidobacterium avesanii]|uniref:peptide-methionine (R)-S-oxide reductase MsrB n=2 Tax=Bifidobacterium avesanii TaxID=1798157 RepID=UPI001EF894AE|nr:peptide-methionine (R)-S-oxide reductase MsrB [Bifidobacterium avesanii]